MYIKVEECTGLETGNVKYVFELEDYVSVENITLAKTFKTLTQMRYMTYADCVFTVAVFTDVNNDMWITFNDLERIC